MAETLVKNSGIWWLKSKFFLYRGVSYFSFLLIPILIPKALELQNGWLLAMMYLYIGFLLSQWFLLGKEVDHRLKIFYRLNSSTDRIAYRLLLGMFVIILFFNLLALLPSKWIYNCFWAFWISLGLFYSWPTRGKIIKESMSSNFNEFKHLDRFEKTLVALICILFVVSQPELPTFSSINSLKLFFDPQEKIGNHFWNFLTVSYYPFKKYPEFLRLAWSTHMYTVNMGMYLLVLYALMRYFVSRRLSLLGIFAALSTWGWSKILSFDHAAALVTTYSLLWVWSMLWVVKSTTYRTGLFLGLISYWGSLLHPSLSFLAIAQALLVDRIFLKEKTKWYRRQVLKYASFGYALCAIVLLSEGEALRDFGWHMTSVFESGWFAFTRKAFFSLAPVGVAVIATKLLIKKSGHHPWRLNGDIEPYKQIFISWIVVVAFSLTLTPIMGIDFSSVWPLVILSVLPLELLFQTISRLRSSRNMIYLIYILICLLDSHFEGRVKIFLRLFGIDS